MLDVNIVTRFRSWAIEVCVLGVRHGGRSGAVAAGVVERRMHRFRLYLCRCGANGSAHAGS